MKKLMSLLISSLVVASIAQPAHAIQAAPYVAGATSLALNAATAAGTALTARYVKNSAASLAVGVVLGASSFFIPLAANKVQTYFGSKKSDEQGLYILNAASNVAFLAYLYTYGANVLKNHPILEYYAIGGTIASCLAGTMRDNDSSCD